MKKTVTIIYRVISRGHISLQFIPSIAIVGPILEAFHHHRGSGAAYVASAAHDSSAEEAGRLAAAAAIATWWKDVFWNALPQKPTCPPEK